MPDDTPLASPSPVAQRPATQAPAAPPLRGGISLAAFSPWPRCCPWLVIGLGVALGTVLGFSPWLFLLIGGVCLLSGWLPASP